MAKEKELEYFGGKEGFEKIVKLTIKINDVLKEEGYTNASITPKKNEILIKLNEVVE